MAEVINVPVPGGGVPPLPTAAVQSGTPDGGNPNGTPLRQTGQQPGFVVPPIPGPVGITQEQVQAQIAAALAAAKPAPVVPEASEAIPFSEITSGVTDPVLSSLTDVFVRLGKGVDIDRAIGNALSRGDASLIDLAYITEKGGANASDLQTYAKAIVERVLVQTEAATSAVYTTAGDKAAWDAASAVFDKNAPRHLKLVISQLLESGDNEAIKAGAQSVMDYVRQNGLVVNPAQLLNAGASHANAGQALGKAEFQDALFKLDQNSRTYDTERNALFARRQLGKQLNK